MTTFVLCVSGSWRTTKEFAPAAGMTQMGIHLTDILIWYFGKVKSVYANTSSRSLGWETGDVVVVQLLFEAGMTANIQAILHTPHFLRTHIFGSKMWAEVRNSTHPDETSGVADLQVYHSLEDTNTFQGLVYLSTLFKSSGFSIILSLDPPEQNHSSNNPFVTIL